VAPERWGFAFHPIADEDVRPLERGDRHWFGAPVSIRASLSITSTRTRRRAGLDWAINRPECNLNSVGWKGIRQRKINLEKSCSHIEKVHSEGKPVHVVDIASGPGRYLLDTLKQISHIPVSAYCVDRS